MPTSITSFFPFSFRDYNHGEAKLFADPAALIAELEALKSLDKADSGGAGIRASNLLHAVQKKLLTADLSIEEERGIFVLLIGQLGKSFDLIAAAEKVLMFSVEYTDLSSEALVEERRVALHRQYEELIATQTTAALILTTLCESGAPSLISEIRGQIDKGAADQKALLSGFEETLVKSITRIKDSTCLVKEKRELMETLFKLHKDSGRTMSLDTFNVVIDALISIRVSSGNDSVEERWGIKCRLFGHYLLDKAGKTGRESGIHWLISPHFFGAFFDDSVFPKKDIIRLFKEEELPSLVFFSVLTLGLLQQQFKENSLTLIDYIKALKPEHIDESFITNLRLILETANPVDWEVLGLLYTHNAAIFNTISDKLVTMKRSNDDNAFILRNKESTIFRFEERATQVLSPLQNFSVDFNFLNTEKQVNENKLRLIAQLKELAETPAIQNAHEVLLALNKEKGTLKEQFVADKMREIEERAWEQLASIAASEGRLASIPEEEPMGHDDEEGSMGHGDEEGSMGHGDKEGSMGHGDEEGPIAGGDNEFNKAFLKCMRSVEEMAKRFKEGTPKHSAATKLCTDLHTKHEEFKKGSMGAPQFETECLKDIGVAREVLEQHRGWKGILNALAIAIRSISKCVGLEENKSYWIFFPPISKTKSEETIDEVAQEIRGLNPPNPKA